MNAIARTTAAAAVAAVTLFAASAAAQQPPPRLSVDELAAQLNLTPEAKQQIAPELERLNQLLTQREEQRQAHLKLGDEMQAARTKIEAALSPEQLRQFRSALWQSHGAAFAPGAGMRGHGPGMMQGRAGMMGGAGGAGMHGRGAGPGASGCPGMGTGPYGPMHHGHWGVPGRPGPGS